jgi:GGDEF domain-containing protein
MVEAEAVALRIQTQVREWAATNELDLSVSFGLGEAPTHGERFGELLERVDRAMYHSKSKQSGGGLAFATCAGVTAAC